MTKVAVCQICLKQFSLTNKQKTFLQKLQNAGQNFSIITCPECSLQTPYLKMEEKILENKKNIYDCPVRNCHGKISFTKNKNDTFWGCDKCGTTWYKESILLQEIASTLTAKQ